MALDDVAREHYAAQQTLARRASAAAVALWALLDPAGLAASWAAQRLGERLFVLLSSGQAAAAGQAPRYVARALGAQGASSDPTGELVPNAYAGVASDGRDLETLVEQPLIRVLTALKQGVPLDRALGMGRSSLETIAETQIADAGRAAEQVAMVVEPRVSGWVRMLVPPSCGRCAVLAGKRFKWNEGFERHPLCDCRHVPAVEDIADDLRTDPAAYFRSLSREDQNKYFTVAGAEAIRLGADIAQVVNARRGASGLSQPGRLTEAEQRALRGGRGVGRLQRVDVYGRQLATTTEGTTVRGVAGKRLAAAGGTTRTAGARLRSAKTPRLMPDAILELAAGDREEAQRLLRRFGYIR